VLAIALEQPLPEPVPEGTPLPAIPPPQEGTEARQ
jgi:hypothetical protein